MVAGYCWKWVSKSNPHAYDIEFPEHRFQMKWNLTEDGSAWIISPNSVNEIGCIHTCQGLEVDYIGVIIGPDMFVKNDLIITDAAARAGSDSSVRGFRQLQKAKPEETRAQLDLIIKNTYRTLMTRGMKGCYVYCTDPALSQYLKDYLKSSTTTHP